MLNHFPDIWKMILPSPAVREGPPHRTCSELRGSHKQNSAKPRTVIHHRREKKSGFFLSAFPRPAEPRRRRGADGSGMQKTKKKHVRATHFFQTREGFIEGKRECPLFFAVALLCFHWGLFMIGVNSEFIFVGLVGCVYIFAWLEEGNGSRTTIRLDGVFYVFGT